MRKMLGVILLSWAVSACEKPLFTTNPRYLLLQDRFAAYAVLPQPEHEPALWATGIVFPDSVNWREQPDAAVAEVFLLKNGETVLSVPAGFQARAERHRFRGGHLWTDTTDGTETIVFCDGEERFRFPGEELLMGFLPVDGQVHTLGQRLGRDGFCYRIDGVEIFSSDQGSIVGDFQERAWPGGALMHDETGVYYVYRVPVRTYQKLDWEYRVMRGAQPVHTILAGTAEIICDVRVYQGVVYSLQRLGTGSLMLVEGEESRRIPELPIEEYGSGILYPLDGSIKVKGYSRLLWNGDYFAWIRDEKGILHNRFSPRPFLEWQPEGESLTAIDQYEGLVGSVWRDVDELPLQEESYRLTSPLCMLCQDGILAVAFTASAGQEHALLIDDQLFPLSFNGFFCSIYIE